eukprot:gene9172-9339_t
MHLAEVIDGDATLADLEELQNDLYQLLIRRFGPAVASGSEASDGSDASELSTSSHNRWHRAVALAHATSDPWASRRIDKLPLETAVRYRYTATTRQWVIDDVLVKLEPRPFAAGAMRECFAMKKLSTFSSSVYRNWRRAHNFVAKKYKKVVERDTYFADVVLQMDTKFLGVGDLYTDPQIHTLDGVGYGDGNLALRGQGVGAGALAKPRPALAAFWLRKALATSAVTTDNEDTFDEGLVETFSETPDGLNPRAQQKQQMKRQASSPLTTPTASRTRTISGSARPLNPSVMLKHTPAKAWKAAGAAAAFAAAIRGKSFINSQGQLIGSMFTLADRLEAAAAVSFAAANNLFDEASEEEAKGKLAQRYFEKAAEAEGAAAELEEDEEAQEDG